MARELEIARRQTARLLSAAPQVVVSHPLREGDRPLRPSPLVAGLPWADPASLPAATTPLLRETLAAGGTLEQLADPTAPPILPGTSAAGGVAIFADQAACPFRAFARHRLHARTPTTPTAGLDALERGTVVHKALEQAWRRLGDQRTLLAMPEAELRALLAEAADAAVSEYAEQHPEGAGPRFLALERQRLAALLEGWMELEKLRAPFRVEAREREIDFEIGGVSGRGRIDRIDLLEDGRAVIIDYKTGSGALSVNSWLGARPDEPQLPLYCVSGEQRPAAVVFAQVRRQEPRFVGVADPPDLIPRALAPEKLIRPQGEPYPSLDALREDWRPALGALGAAFRAGAAAVDPKPPDACKHCDLPALCRIAERAAGGETEEQGDG
jgi:probable DNA repair protein